MKSMQGIEICRRYYENYGGEMIHNLFPEYENRIAAGIMISALASASGLMMRPMIESALLSPAPILLFPMKQTA